MKTKLFKVVIDSEFNLLIKLFDRNTCANAYRYKILFYLYPEEVPFLFIC